MPKGLGAFLRSSDVGVSERGALVVKPLPGPAVERLGEASVQEQIRRGLSPFLAGPLDLRIEVAPTRAEASGRVTREEVTEDTLKALFRQEPRLERAVEELDLELME